MENKLDTSNIVINNLSWILEDFIKEIEKKNPVWILFNLLNSSIKISDELNNFIAGIELNSESNKSVIDSLAYDLIWKDNFKIILDTKKDTWYKLNNLEKIKELKKILENEKINLNSIWTINFKEWFFKDNYELLKDIDNLNKNFNTSEIKAKIEKYYEIDIYDLIWAIKDIYNACEKNKNNSKKKDINIEEEYYNKLTDFYKELNNLFLIKNKEINKDKVIKDKLKDNNDVILKLIQYRKDINYIYDAKINSKISEVKFKLVLFNAIILKDFIVSIYQSPILKLFSNIIIKKLILKTNKDLIKQDNYKILKYITLYISPKDRLETFWVEQFFKEFEEQSLYKIDIIKKMKGRYDFNNLFMLLFVSTVFIIFWNFLLLDNKYFDTIIISFIWFFIFYMLYQFTNMTKIIFWFIVSLTFLLFIYFKNPIINYLEKPNKVNKLILLSSDNLYFSWIVLNTNSWSIDINKIMPLIYDKYKTEKAIEFSKEGKNKLEKDILSNSWNYLDWNVLNLWKLEIEFQKEISK